MIDMRHFPQEFVDKLLASFGNLDAMTDGVLVHSENWQGLNLLTERYREHIQCIYIDPPYNTDTSAIQYKNGYKASCWVSLINDRLLLSKQHLEDRGVIVAAIDDEQQRELNHILSCNFDERLLGTICVRSNPSGRPTQTGYAVSHEYLLFAGKSELSRIGRLPPTETQMTRFSERDEFGQFEWRNLRREGSNSDRSARRALYYPIYVCDGTIRIPSMEWNENNQAWVVLDEPHRQEQVIWPDNEDGLQKTWRWEWSTVMDRLSNLSVRKDRLARDYIYYKRRPNDEGVVSISSWFEAKYSAIEYGTSVIKNLFSISSFSYPKSIHAVKDAIYIAGAANRSSIVLDFFAGSGTTGHAVINLNREDGGRRKFILIEMAHYFDTVLLPRLKKVAYSPEWKDGQPKREATAEEAERGPRLFKVIRLESYEDALNNIAFEADGPQATLQFDDYLLQYMLAWEARNSDTLLNVKQLANPFAYQLRVHRDGETRTQPVDLAETFNALLGLRVKTRTVLHSLPSPADGEGMGVGGNYLIYRGATREGRNVVVIWRNTENWKQADHERDRDFVAAHKLAEGADDVYVNGDSLIAGAQALDGLFKARMFAPVAQAA